MSRIVSYDAHQYDGKHWTHTYVTDDFHRLVHDTRTGEWTLHRIPTPEDILDAEAFARGLTKVRPTTNIPYFVAPIRYVPPVRADLTDAPRHSAEVADDE